MKIMMKMSSLMAFWIMAPVSLASEVQYEFLFRETILGQKSSDFLAYSNSNTRDLAYFFRGSTLYKSQILRIRRVLFFVFTKFFRIFP
jgi:hypothetical protein